MKTKKMKKQNVNLTRGKIKKLKWREIFDASDKDNNIVSVYRDWISYKDIGFNPNIHKDAIQKKKDEVKILELALKKWEQEFKPLKNQNEN